MLGFSNEAVKFHKAVLTIFECGIMIGILLPSLGLAGDGSSTEREIFRSLAVVASLFISGYALLRIWGFVSSDTVSPYADLHDVLDGRSQSTIGRMETVFFLTFVSLVLETSLMSLGYQQGHLIAFGVSAIVLRFVMLAVNAHAVLRLNHIGCNSEYVAYTHVLDEAETSSTLGSLDSSQEELKLWYIAQRLRSLMSGSFNRGYKYILAILVVLCLCTVTHFTYEFYKIFSQQEPILSPSVVNEQKKYSKTASYMPRRLHSSYKVHLVVVDGLRYDLTREGASSLGDLINAPTFRNASLQYKAMAQLPSFSVPNWLTMLTGALPETHGVTGNLLAEETSFDHIFQQARNYQVHAGMTGTTWWRDLVFSTLPTLDGDGTVAASFVPEGSPEYPKSTADPADWERLRTAVKAIRRNRVPSPFGLGSVRNFYELFLTHFSDVDMQGHEYGISVEWNTDNSYMRAIDNKTEAIRRIIDEMDNSTILIITSDHGHLKRGGHGGVSEELRDVPIVFYNKAGIFDGNKQFDNTTNRFTQDTYPRNIANQTDYQNVDLCSTITALLGIPSPRQSIGIFIEDPIHQALAAANISSSQNLLYYDLFMAKLAAVRSYADTFSSAGFLSDIGEPATLRDPAIKALEESLGTASIELYVAGTQQLVADFWRMRNARKKFVEDRNIATSIITGIPAVFMVVYIITMHGPANIHAIIKRRNRSSYLNTSTCIAAFITVLAFFAVSIASFIIWYAADGWGLWDSTLTHTTSVAPRFLVRAVVIPIIAFIFFTKLFLAHAIVWRTQETWDAIQERRIRQKSISSSNFVSRGAYFITDVVRLLAAGLRDCATVVFATSRYKPHLFPRVTLYFTYLALWTMIASVLLLMCQCPYTYIFPIVFSTQHVTENNLEYRFRVITVLMMVMPLQIGTALLLWILPSQRKQDDMCAWDHLWVTAYLHNDWQVVQEAEEKPKTERQLRLGKESIVNISSEYRRELVSAAIMLLMRPMLRVSPDLLHLADLSGAKAIGEGGEADEKGDAQRDQLHRHQRQRLRDSLKRSNASKWQESAATAQRRAPAVANEPVESYASEEPARPREQQPKAQAQQPRAVTVREPEPEKTTSRQPQQQSPVEERRPQQQQQPQQQPSSRRAPAAEASPSSSQSLKQDESGAFDDGDQPETKLRSKNSRRQLRVKREGANDDE